MPDGTGSPEQGQREPQYKEETLQYADGQLGILLTGESGAGFDWKHKWSPTVPLEQGEAIVSTKGRRRYYLYEDSKGGVYIVDIRASDEKGEPVGAYKPEDIPLASIKFGQPWKLEPFTTTSEVESVLLRHKIADPNAHVGRKIPIPNPFDKCREQFRKPTP
jgi:hypothetical protein